MKHVLLIVLAGGAVMTTISGALIARAMNRSSQPTNSLDSALSLNQPDSDATAVAPSDEFPVFINRPSGPPRVDTGMLDDLGRAVTVSCGSCHANLEPNLAVRDSSQLQEFHQGLHFNHGSMSCLTCHNATNYNTLRLADGSSLQFEDVLSLCSQCHIPQARDYARGAHGGMNGYWDRTRGPQIRKNCIDCHDPHAPAFPSMTPTFKPHDRFLEKPHATGAGDHE